MACVWQGYGNDIHACAIMARCGQDWPCPYAGTLSRCEFVDAKEEQPLDLNKHRPVDGMLPRL